jgi:hypothetical protein
MFYMSPLGRNPYCDSIVHRTQSNSSSKWLKNVKIQKIRYKSVITKISVDFVFRHVLRSVCNLQVQDCMRRSCSTYCLSTPTCIFSTKSAIYWFFLLSSVILRSGKAGLYVFLPNFVLAAILLRNFPYLYSWVGASFGYGFGPNSVSSFEWRTIDRRIEGCVMRKRNSRKEVLHVFILRIIAFGEASIEVLHESFYHDIGSWVMRSGGDLFNA